MLSHENVTPILVEGQPAEELASTLQEHPGHKDQRNRRYIPDGGCRCDKFIILGGFLIAGDGWWSRKWSTRVQTMDCTTFMKFKIISR